MRHQPGLHYNPQLDLELKGLVMGKDSSEKTSSVIQNLL